jgi:ferredoxin-NADP reductase
MSNEVENRHVVKILESTFISHDMKLFRVEKPTGFTFIPGQATEVSINLPKWEHQKRPFTFTSLPDWDFLEFMIKIYDDHTGVTDMLGKTHKDAELILHDVFGTIQYKGPGVFIAGGAGITPFISIFRSLSLKKEIRGNKLIFSNKTSDDFFLGNELSKMFKSNHLIKVFTRENVVGFVGRRIDRDFLIENVQDFSKHFYVCGPDGFVKSINHILIDLGAHSQSLVFEQ